MRAGGIRSRVTLLEPVALPDGQGGQSVTYTAAATVSARVEPLSGEETIVARRLVADVTHEFAIRFSPAVKAMVPTWRIWWNRKTLEVLRVLDVDARERELRGLAKEVAA
jgi:SPP1 family predicted phage head-tail adaptor